MESLLPHKTFAGSARHTHGHYHWTHTVRGKKPASCHTDSNDDLKNKGQKGLPPKTWIHVLVEINPCVKSELNLINAPNKCTISASKVLIYFNYKESIPLCSSLVGQTSFSQGQWHGRNKYQKQHVANPCQALQTC